MWLQVLLKCNRKDIQDKSTSQNNFNFWSEQHVKYTKHYHFLMFTRRFLYRPYENLTVLVRDIPFGYPNRACGQIQTLLARDGRPVRDLHADHVCDRGSGRDFEPHGDVCRLVATG